MLKHIGHSTESLSSLNRLLWRFNRLFNSLLVSDKVFSMSAKPGGVVVVGPELLATTLEEGSSNGSALEVLGFKMS